MIKNNNNNTDPSRPTRGKLQITLVKGSTLARNESLNKRQNKNKVNKIHRGNRHKLKTFKSGRNVLIIAKYFTRNCSPIKNNARKLHKIFNYKFQLRFNSL